MRSACVTGDLALYTSGISSGVPPNSPSAYRDWNLCVSAISFVTSDIPYDDAPAANTRGYFTSVKRAVYPPVQHIPDKNLSQCQKEDDSVNRSSSPEELPRIAARLASIRRRALSWCMASTELLTSTNPQFPFKRSLERESA